MELDVAFESTVTAVSDSIERTVNMSSSTLKAQPIDNSVVNRVLVPVIEGEPSVPVTVPVSCTSKSPCIVVLPFTWNLEVGTPVFTPTKFVIEVKTPPELTVPPLELIEILPVTEDRETIPLVVLIPTAPVLLNRLKSSSSVCIKSSIEEFIATSALVVELSLILNISTPLELFNMKLFSPLLGLITKSPPTSRLPSTLRPKSNSFTVALVESTTYIFKLSGLMYTPLGNDKLLLMSRESLKIRVETSQGVVKIYSSIVSVSALERNIFVPSNFMNIPKRLPADDEIKNV